MSQERHRDRIPGALAREEHRHAGHERRKDKRIRADKTFFIGCKPSDPGVSFADPNLAVKLLDISARGACFVSRVRLKGGLRVQILIVQPGAGTRSSVDATVRWSESVERDGKVAHVTGVEFDRPMAGLGLPEEPARPVQRRPATVRAGTDPRRHHKRFKPDNTTITCMTRDGLLRKFGFRPNAAEALLDISLSGAQIVCDRKLDVREVLDLEIVLADGKTTIATEGTVCWCRRDTLSLKPRWTVGLRFGRLDEDAKRSLIEVQQLHVR
jgi:c-di-GMP-binding flagellar brake protein YcgR